MRYFLVVLAALAVAWAARGQGGDAGAEDLKKLQGDWLAVEFDGKKVEEKFAPRLSVKGNKLTVVVDGKAVSTETITLDATKKPRHIDMMTDGPDKERGPGRGIYEFVDNDTLRLSVGATVVREFNGKKEVVPSKRPADFNDKDAPALLLKRAKG